MDENEKPIMYIIAGPCGSGKSTLFNKFKANNPRFAKLDFINNDEIANELHRNSKDRDTPFNDLSNNKRSKFNHYAATVADAIKKRYLEAGVSFGYETVAATPESSTAAIDLAHAKGFQVDVKYVILPDVAMNIGRVQERVIQGGHNVPEEAIRARYQMAKDLMPEILAKADHAVLYDNAIYEKVQPVLTKDGNKVSLSPSDVWPKEKLLAEVFHKMKEHNQQLRLVTKDKDKGMER